MGQYSGTGTGTGTRTQRRACTHMENLLVYLGGRSALMKGREARDHFQGGHSKGVDVDLLVVVQVIELRGHELWGPKTCHCSRSDFPTCILLLTMEGALV